MPPPTSQGPPPLSNQPPSPIHYNPPPPTSQIGYNTNLPPPISGYAMSNTPGAPSSFPPPSQPGQPSQTHSGKVYNLRDIKHFIRIDKYRLSLEGRGDVSFIARGNECDKTDITESRM